jgi:DnaJ-class molecular chaperone
MKTCPECEGTGVVDEGTDDERRCPTCGGSGFVPDDEGGDDQGVVRTEPDRASSEASESLGAGRSPEHRVTCCWLSSSRNP